MLAETGVKWDVTVDVAVIGCGCAGVVAAVTAKDEGAEVIILEKQPSKTLHTNSNMSGGIFISPESVKTGVTYLENLCRADNGMSWTDKEVINAWAEYTADNRAWVEKNGGKIHDFPSSLGDSIVTGMETIQTFRFNGLGEGMGRFLSEQLEKRQIRVMHETSARRLLTNRKGEVIGVEAGSNVDGGVKRIRVKAAKGVILASGGFEFNEQMKLNYLRVFPVHFNGTEANTGDGINMALDVGADLWHMNCMAGGFGMKFPEFPFSFGTDFGGMRHLLVRPGGGQIPPEKRAGFILVDRYGRRFLNEGKSDHTTGYALGAFDSQKYLFPRVPSYWIFDRKRLELSPLTRLTSGPAGPTRLYHWSQDNSAEVQKGWILTAGTVRELARKIDLSPEVLESSIATYNGYCEKGIDADFGREQSSLIPVNNPPYFAVKLLPGGANTQGGPKRNAKSEIVHPNGEPIPGLYSAGELGSVFGMFYKRGGNVAECIAFGRIAGENAARRK